MIYLIDFENVHEEGFSALGRLGDKDAVYCFFTRNAAKIGMSALANMRSGQLHFIEAESGKQSLDLALVSYLGYLIGTRPQELYYDIISNDNGFAKVAEFWNKRGNGLRVRIRKTNDLKPKAEPAKVQPANNSRRQQVQPVQKITEQPDEEKGTAAEPPAIPTVTVQPVEVPQPEVRQDAARQPAQKRSGRQRSQRQRGAKQPEQAKPEEKKTDEVKAEAPEQPAPAEPVQSAEAETAAVKPAPKPVDPAASAALEAAGINAAAVEFIQAQAEKYREDKNKKQLVYRAVVKKYGQKVGTQIYNSAKKLLLK
ncbi:MAG: hypothetical protein IJV40_12935 [Oscillospiraceae bacterium]|nr:hypothetical protein [Oscillospiraceae bacterium]